MRILSLPQHKMRHSGIKPIFKFVVRRASCARRSASRNDIRRPPCLNRILRQFLPAHADSAKKVPLPAFRTADVRSSHANKTWSSLCLNLSKVEWAIEPRRKMKYVALRRPVERNWGRTKSVINHTEPAPDYNTIKSISEATKKYCKVELTFQVSWTPNWVRSWFFLA